MTNAIKIAFIGGCLNKQYGINDHDLYFNRIIKESHSGLDPIIIELAHYNSYNELFPRGTSLLKKAEPEYLFVFIRPYPIWVLNKPIIKILTAEGKRRRVIHPSLFRRQLNTWPDKYTKNFQPIHSMQPTVSLIRQMLQDTNLVLGMIAGLNYWATRYVTSEILKLTGLSDDRNKVVIIGPPSNQETFIRNYICKLLNKSLKKLERNNKIEFIDIFTRYDSFGNLLFTDDGIHYNNHGHNFIKDKVINYLLKAKSERYK
jgi:hypothetical protein